MKKINPTGNETIFLEKGETKTIYLEDKENGNRDYSLTVIHKESFSSCFINGKITGNNTDKKHWKIKQICHGKDQIAKINIQGFAENQSFLVLDAQGILDKTSSNGVMHINEKILIFDKAKINAIPVLTTNTNNTKEATHSCSISPIPKDIKFLFATRGFSEKKIREFLKENF